MHVDTVAQNPVTDLLINLQNSNWIYTPYFSDSCIITYILKSQVSKRIELEEELVYMIFK